jgi:predicted DNA binding CopG/RHH family protein
MIRRRVSLRRQLTQVSVRSVRITWASAWPGRHDPCLRAHLRRPLPARGSREEDLPQEGAMTMTKQTERLPRPAAELERLAEYYDTHDTSAEMEPGHWAEPHPMATTSLRLPVEVIDQLKQQARERHLRYTSYVRSILERAARGDTSPEIADITERLERIERAVTERQKPGDQKTA